MFFFYSRPSFFGVALCPIDCERPVVMRSEICFNLVLFEMLPIDTVVSCFGHVFGATCNVTEIQRWMRRVENPGLSDL